MGVMGVYLSTRVFGWLALGYVEYVIAVERAFPAWMVLWDLLWPAHNSLLRQTIFSWPVAKEQKKKIHSQAWATGEWLGAWGLTEPGSGSDAGGRAA